MNSLLLALILIPAVEIYLFIKIGASISAFNTVLLIFFTAFIGILRKVSRFKHFKSGIKKNDQK